ncbi:hypothetical protein ASPWEDRAFT_34249 [Aspergillus wentii DTO 134E9]|uniref:Meiotic nuclear division protein 1 n=1 Tax=Aspergillus wentii DTO 134E9 TaxID=1073089 RepID=A0A1L9S0T8_ASPWE|nr:uncharacterized protein ASPWEDRAFT_34249 [Aspergillus wentii DTO 134E9]KAI9931215.1 hypothetical protein MW887_010876 [Aspergillus wentii]OJJ40777.1 hypothetical protein ASPWEDRAFT_34249 [Aspergillus wentii DTO 134E9]
MPPKLSKSAKLDLIVSHLRSTRTCHTLKNLEKMLPSVASINGMQVKEYIQNLTDENQLRVEKIGSGNWYWCFASDDKKAREQQRDQLLKDVEKAQASFDAAEKSLATQREKMEEEDEEDEEEREELIRQKTGLEKEVRQLQVELKAASAAEGGKGIEEKKEELDTLRQEAEMWTDNIYVLEGYLGKLAGGDREIIAAIQRECYGEEYVEGEGLREMV